ncbi:GIY-YIG nuclease family protein [Candidatus Pelagibacter sp.]|nr:GIY-YIG nuclease family protein [Candidatus Pelagibacter sp.]
MTFYVYLIVTEINGKIVSYVGYTNNLKKRLKLHNSSKGAKFTRGKKWKMIYFKNYKSKKIAMSEEYKLKKNYSLRKKIKQGLEI